MNKIQATIDRVLAGKLHLETQPDYCLRAARQVVEAANGWGGGEFFSHINIFGNMTDLNRRQAPGVPWARSAEQAFINKGWTVPVSQAEVGDLVFSRQPASCGHIGVVGQEGGHLMVLENATVRRGRSLGGALNWVPLAQWSGLTTVGRMPREWVYDSPVIVPAKAAPPVAAVMPANVAGVKVLVPDGHGGWQNVAGRRVELPLPGGGVLVVNNALDKEDVWVDIRGAL